MQSSQTQRRTLLITGANKGIGFAIVDKLLSEATPYEIILTSRDVKLGEAAIEKLKAKHTKSTSILTYHQLDVNDNQTVENLLKWLKETNKKIDVLVNNAGVLHYQVSDDLKRHTIQTNFFGVVNLTEKLIPFLTDDAKILQLSSFLGQLAIQGEILQKALTDPKLTEKRLHEIANNIIELTPDFKTFGPIIESSYPASKALLNFYTKDFLPAKLKPTQQVYSVNPGWVKTDMGGEGAPLTLEEGIDTPIYLIGLPHKVHPELNAKLIGERKVMVF